VSCTALCEAPSEDKAATRSAQGARWQSVHHVHHVTILGNIGSAVGSCDAGYNDDLSVTALRAMLQQVEPLGCDMVAILGGQKHYR
jgi:hypothetical protein